MTIQFPNQSRYYDASLHAVGFWGHDGAMEAPFFVDEDALKQIQPGTGVDEASLLNAFDLNRDQIHVAAAKMYDRGRKGSYDLGPTDF
ncbi:MAG: DUF1488 domain-containing protein [Reyranella sp.]|nr:DUF1488 domain-containing protein [Reyranella sp.]